MSEILKILYYLVQISINIIIINNQMLYFSYIIYNYHMQMSCIQQRIANCQC